MEKRKIELLRAFATVVIFVSGMLSFNFLLLIFATVISFFLWPY